MAESKKTSAKGKVQSNADLAEQLRLAAEILDGAAEQPTEGAAAKKPAAKKPAAKKTAAKSDTAKAPAKKPTTKKPATKAVKDETAESEPKKTFGNRRSDCKNCGAENDKYALVCHACGAQLPPLPEGMVPPTQPEPVVEENLVEQPAAEQKPAEQPVEQKPIEQPVVEEKPAVEEKPVEEKTEQQPATAQAQPEQKPAQEKPAKKSGSFLDKASNFINNKGKLPLWIVANVLLLLSSIFLLAGSFSIPSMYGKAQTGNMFTYYGNATAIKAYWQGTAGKWANGGYAMMGILMFISFIGPLALIAKNIVLFILKKKKDVYMFDAIITFTFLVAYLGVVGMYGANVTWAHVLCLIMSIILLAYTIFVILLETRGGKFPFFSIANLVWILLCVFLLTNTKIYDAPRCYAAFVAALDGGAGFAFIMLLISLAALALLIVMQVKKLPGKIAWLFEFLVPAVAGVCAFIALVTFAGLTPTGFGMGGGFVCGAVFTLLLAIADVVFALVPQLHKFNVKVADRAAKETTPAEAPAPADQPESEQPVTVEQPTAQPESEQPTPAAENNGKVACPTCGMENGKDDMFCMKCGRNLNK